MRRARTVPALLLALALACLTHSAAGAGVFELQILEFSNYRLRLSSGACCGGGAPAGGVAPCAQPCRTRFALCLKEYQSTAAPGACSFGRAASPVLGTDSFTLAEPLYTLSLPFSFRWTRSCTLILQAYDDYNYTDPDETGLIEEAWWSGIVEPGAEWHALRHAGGAASLAFRVRVTCQPNYYNATCTTFCRPRDDKFGHYSCSQQGDKRCLPGWQGDNCEKPVCKQGCHPTHGRCDRPGDCDCRPGWRGELCAQCQPYPGCKHGYCNGSSWDCTCDTNWGGILCDQDLNYCGTHEPCQHGGTCENTAPDQYLCTCAEGFSGVDCERVDNPCAPQPCTHGVCTLAVAPPGYACACEPGWTSTLCDRDVDDCASAPCAHGATCRDLVDAFACDCAPGWTGATCTDDVDECATSREGSEVTDGALGPCVNAASCNNTAGGYACTCLAGWTGRDCELNVDDCTGQCLHGATCIDLVDDFHCACAAGYAGRTCARDVDDCAPRPCRNGGECVDLLDAYRCICPVGFSGTDCELSSCFGRYCPDDRDHCAGNPCANGAPCYTAQSDYYCHCAPGWTGKNCTSRAPPARPGASPCIAGAPCRNGHCVTPAPASPATHTTSTSIAPFCVCSPGYAGPLCTERIEDCVVSGCGSGGSCLDTGAGSRCVCRAGVTGPRCEHEIDECAMNPCRNNATCVDGPADFACLCLDGWTGKTCSVRLENGHCTDGVCANGGTCVREQGTWRCACAAGWSGAACDAPAGGACACLHGSCVAQGSGWACACRDGWAGARCELAVDGCASAPCRNSARCVGGAGWWACECGAGWAGPDCSAPRAAPAPCVPPCPAPATCTHDAIGARCVCPEAPARAATRCLEAIAGLGFEDDNGGVDGVDGSEVSDIGEEEARASAWGGAAGACASNGTWWWGCNACACGSGGRTPVCTRLWCGLPDCLAPRASPCRTDEVCVPAAPALCLRAPCAPLGECRRVSGRRVEPPALPAPPACWPGARPPAPAAPSAGCARAQLQLARERLARGAHVERACAALRRALATVLAARAPPAPPLVLLCDLAPDDDDALDLALWIGEEEGSDSVSNAETLATAVRALSELVSRRRLASHALLGAALRLRVPHPPPPPAPQHAPQSGALLALAAIVPLLLLGAGATVLLIRRRRIAAATERSRRCDEEKSNNLQNEENLRRYANPLRDEPLPMTHTHTHAHGAPADELPRAHTLYKAQNADARNNTPPRDKELTKRALPPPEPPPARRPPPERLTVLV